MKMVELVCTLLFCALVMVSMIVLFKWCEVRARELALSGSTGSWPIIIKEAEYKDGVLTTFVFNIRREFMFLVVVMGLAVILGGAIGISVLFERISISER